MQTQQDTSTSSSYGWHLAIWLGLGVAVACVAVLVLSPTLADGARMAIRLTARTSLLLFLLAFTASSLAKLLPSPTTIWLRANRRYFGVAFAFSHFIHAAAIFALAELNPALFGQLTTPASFIAGGFGYAVIIAMFVTSFDRVALMVGADVWHPLHKVGAWLIAAFFVVNFGRRAVVTPQMYWPYLALLFAAVVVRLLAAGRKSRTNAL